MPVEVDVTYAAPIAEGISGFGVGASGTETEATRYLWTVPDDVFSISVALWPGYVRHSGEHPGVIPPLVLYNVPTAPGELWLLEPGCAERYGFPVGAVSSASFGGGPGGGGGGGFGSDGYGFAGASATVLSKRLGGGDEIHVVLGGEGGQYQEGSFPPGYPTQWASSPGPNTYGAPTPFPGSGSDGEAGDYLGGGGGGGWPGGDKAPGDRLAGFSGGNYLPESTDLGGERSPTWDEARAPTPFPSAPGPTDFVLFGALFVWYFSDDPTGWIIGAVGFG